METQIITKEKVYPDYAKGKIYMLIDTSTTPHKIIYVGSTTISLSCRFTKHVCKSTTCHTRKLYTITGDWTNIKIELIENYPSFCKQMLEEKEREYIELLNPIGNTYIPTQTLTEYYKKNKKQIQLIKSKPYTCKCGITLTINHKSRHEKSQKHQDYIKTLL